MSENKPISLLDLIPHGQENAIPRKGLLKLAKSYGLCNDDRQMRGIIEQLRNDNVILNMQDGAGYFIPDDNDMECLRHYIAAQTQRFQSISNGLDAAHALLDEMEIRQMQDLQR